jgi:hypothetical protein
MKIAGLIFTFFFCSLFCYAQITIRDVVIKEEVKKPMVYDSTYLWHNPLTESEDELKKYIGQEIYIFPISKNNKDRFYFDFFMKR